MKLLFTILLLSSIVVKGQTNNKAIKLSKEDLEAIEVKMTQFFYNKDKVDQNLIVYSVLELYDEYIAFNKADTTKKPGKL